MLDKLTMFCTSLSLITTNVGACLTPYFLVKSTFSSASTKSNLVEDLSNNFSAILQLGQVFVPNNNISVPEVVVVVVETSE